MSCCNCLQNFTLIANVYASIFVIVCISIFSCFILASGVTSAYKGRNGVVRQLLERGANVNLQNVVSERYGCGVDVGC